MKTLKDKQIVGELVSAKHQELKNRGYHPAPIDRAMVGVVLYLVKQALPKRRYLPWLREYTTLSQRQGARYIARLREFVATKEQREQVEQVDAEMLQMLVERDTAVLRRR